MGSEMCIRDRHYGEVPSLTKLAEGDNLAYTTDFRRVYQTLISGWLEHGGSQDILRGEFKTFDMFS